MIKCERNHEIFAWLSKMITGSGNHFANVGELIKIYLGSHLKYHLSEHESFRELHKVREAVTKQFMSKQRTLFDRKEKLFRNKDLS